MISSVDSQIAVRLNDLDLTRCVEQVAIVSALLVGRGIERKRKKGGNPKQISRGHTARTERYESLALASMLGYLSDSYCKGTIVQPPFKQRVSEADRSRSPRTYDLWEKFGDKPFGRYPKREQDDATFDLDFVVLPVDGVDELRLGVNGALSLLAGGPSGSFSVPSGAPDYLVVSTSPRYTTWLESRIINNHPGLFDPATPWERVLHLIDTIHKWNNRSAGNASGRLEFTVGAMPSRDMHGNSVDENYHNLVSELSRSYRLRTFAGSRIAGAVTALLPSLGIDAYVGLMDATRAVLTATAVCCGSGCFAALPCADGKKARWLAAKDLVKGDDVFLVASGITEHPTLQGVRFRGDHVVFTHTMCMRSKTRSWRFVKHLHNLEEKQFRILSEKKPMLSYDELLLAIE